jgi:hypothetical protein
MRAFCLLVLLLVFGQQAWSQTGLSGRVFVLHEGTPASSGEIGYWSLGCNTYKKIEDLPAYGNSLFEYRDTLYATDGAGDIRLYDLKTQTRLRILEKTNARQVNVWNNYLLTTCNVAPFFRVYDRSDNFKQVYASNVKDIKNEAEGLFVSNDRAFVAVNGLNGFGVNKETDSTIAVYDLKKMRLERKLYTYPNPNNIVETGGFLYVQSLNYTGHGLTVTRIDPGTLNVVGHFPMGILSAGGFYAVDDMLFVGETDPLTFATKGIRTIDLKTMKLNEGIISGNFYTFSFIPKYAHFITSETDYATSGSVALVGLEDGQTRFGLKTAVSPRAYYFQDLPSYNIPKHILGKDTTNCDLTGDYRIPIPNDFPKDALVEWSDTTVGNAWVARTDRNNTFTIKITTADGCTYFDTVRVYFGIKSEIKLFDRWGTEWKDSIPSRVVFVLATSPLEIVSWDFGQDANPPSAASGRTHTIVYNSIGTKTITLQMRNGDCVATFTKTFEVLTPDARPNLISDVHSVVYIPESQSIRLSFTPDASVKRITLTDLQGRVVYQSEGMTETISTENQAQGLYLLRIESEQGSRIEKLWLY